MSTKDRKITHRVLIDTARLANANGLKSAPFGLVVQRGMKEYRLMLKWRSGGRTEQVIIGSPLHVMVAINAVLSTVAAMAVLSVVVSPAAPAEHRLVIDSLHDARAGCSCGMWSLSKTGPMLPDDIAEAHQLHVESFAG